MASRLDGAITVPMLSLEISMKRLPALLLASLPLVADPPRFGFLETRSEFLQWVAEGQGDPQLDLHLVEYAADPGWAATWRRARFERSGLSGQWGSTSSHRLFSDAQVLMQGKVSETLRFGYEQRIYADGRFDESLELVRLTWGPGNLGLILSGWPAARKAEGSVGLGVRWSKPGGGPVIELNLIESRPFWNEKRQGPESFRRRPRRVLLDGNWTSAHWQWDGSLDLGASWRLEETTEPGLQVLERSQRSLKGSGWRSFASEGYLGLDFAWRDLQRSQTGGSIPAFSLSRTHWRFGVQAAWPWAKGKLHGSWALVDQQDQFEAQGLPGGHYRFQSAILGAEFSLRWGKGMELRGGALASPFRLRRDHAGTGETLTVLPLLRRSGLEDKAHLRLIKVFRPGAYLEGLLSHTLSGESFGGASIKVCFLF